MSTRPAVFCDGCDELISGERVIPTVTAEERYQGTDWHPTCWQREQSFPTDGPCAWCGKPLSFTAPKVILTVLADMTYGTFHRYCAVDAKLARRAA